jgi:prepilin signal peptidase PulO-like enzyme (type II secretory pathway)
VSSLESKKVQFLAFALLGLFTFRALQGEWVDAGWVLVGSGIIFAIVIWGADHPTDAQRVAGRIRRLTMWTLPIFFVLFAVVAIHDIRDGEWLGAVYAIASFFVFLVALWFKRRRSADLPR